MPFVNFIKIKDIFWIHLFQDPVGSFQIVFLFDSNNNNNRHILRDDYGPDDVPR